VSFNADTGRCSGAWKMMFHQQTPLEQQAGAAK
jgi:hypothetical protein